MVGKQTSLFHHSYSLGTTCPSPASWSQKLTTRGGGTLERMFWCPPTELSFKRFLVVLSKNHIAIWVIFTKLVGKISLGDQKKTVKMADVLASRKCGVRFMKAADSTVTFPQKEVMITAQNDLFWILWEMKKFVRRWWAEHDTPEFGHSIVAGTMRRMQKCANLNGLPVCDYYTVSVLLHVVYMCISFDNLYKNIIKIV